ncbi:MAG: maleylpyruvate isomerase family mycothiol-dependent enzyme [Nocardioides sp.]
MRDNDLTPLVHAATQRLVRSVDALEPERWTQPSALPGWTRAHVIAHLTLNAEALAGVLAGVTAGSPVAMYPSQEARDADIAALATSSRRELRDRLLASTTDLAQAAAHVPDPAWSTLVERVPGGTRSFPADAVPSMRLREVEIHHVDLDAGYRHTDWPLEFAEHLVDAMTARSAPTPGVVVVASDLDRTWAWGDGGPRVTGPVRALGWWLTGRGDGADLTSDSGWLPRLETL